MEEEIINSLSEPEATEEVHEELDEINSVYDYEKNHENIYYLKIPQKWTIQ